MLPLALREKKTELQQAIGSIGVAISLSFFFHLLPAWSHVKEDTFSKSIISLILYEKWPIISFISFLFISIKGYIQAGKEKLELMKKHKVELNQAQEKIQSIRIKFCETLLELSREYLRQIWRENFDSSGTLRITLYFHHDNFFYNAGRWSKNPNYVKQGRFKIPDYQGCLGEAWLDDGNNYSASLSSMSLDEICSKYKFSKEDYEKLSMKSTLFEIRPIFDHHDKKVGLLVFETTNNHFPLRDKRKKAANIIDEIVERHHDFFIKIITTLKPISLKTIYKEGTGDE
ncbi:hypothetical protein JCM12298_26920 [Desulfothermus naphthae]